MPVLKTEVIRKTLNPSWKPLDISVQHLCNGDLEVRVVLFPSSCFSLLKSSLVVQRPLKIEVFDWNRSGRHEFIGASFFPKLFFFLCAFAPSPGSFTTTLNSLQSGNTKRFTLHNAEIAAKKRNYVGSGFFIVEKFQVGDLLAVTRLFVFRPF